MWLIINWNLIDYKKKPKTLVWEREVEKEMFQAHSTAISAGHLLPHKQIHCRLRDPDVWLVADLPRSVKRHWQIKKEKNTFSSDLCQALPQLAAVTFPVAWPKFNHRCTRCTIRINKQTPVVYFFKSPTTATLSKSIPYYRLHIQAALTDL